MPMSFLEGGGLSTVATMIGIPSIMIGIFMQIRSYKKDQKEQQEKNRAAITTEINTKTEQLFTNVESKLEAIKIAAIIGKEDIMVLKMQLIELQKYVNDLDREGTVEWKKTKPYIMEKITGLAERISDLEKRYIVSVDELKKGT